MMELSLDRSSLASQAVGPPLSNFEMSCANRTFPDIGVKILKDRALKFQEVHPNDSVARPLPPQVGQGAE